MGPGIRHVGDRADSGAGCVCALPAPFCCRDFDYRLKGLKREHSMLPMLRIVPTCAFFHPGEPITLHTTLDQPVSGEIRVSVYHLAEKVAQWTATLREGRAVVEGRVPDVPRRGYLVHAQIAEA